MGFFSFLMSAVFRLLPPQGGESVAPYQAFGAHPLMQITEVLHITHCSKSLYTNITPFFPTLQADPSDSANDTKTAPASCYGNRGGLLYFICALYSRFFKLSRNYLRGFLIAGWAGAKIIEYSETSMDVYGLSGSQMPCPFPAGRAADKPLCRTWAVHLPKAECQAAG